MLKTRNSQKKFYRKIWLKLNGFSTNVLLKKSTSVQAMTISLVTTTTQVFIPFLVFLFSALLILDLFPKINFFSFRLSFVLCSFCSSFVLRFLASFLWFFFSSRFLLLFSFSSFLFSSFSSPFLFFSFFVTEVGNPSSPTPIEAFLMGHPTESQFQLKKNYFEIENVDHSDYLSSFSKKIKEIFRHQQNQFPTKNNNFKGQYFFHSF